MPEKLLLVEDVAEILNCKNDRVYSLVRGKIISAVYLGRQLRFSKAAIEDFINNGGQTLSGGWKRND